MLWISVFLCMQSQIFSYMIYLLVHRFFRVLQIVLTFLHNVSYRIHITGFWPDFNIRRWKWWWCSFGQEGKQASDRCLRPCFNISVTTWDVLTRPLNISSCVSGDRTTSTALSQHNIKKVGIKTSKVLNWVLKFHTNICMTSQTFPVNWN